MRHLIFIFLFVCALMKPLWGQEASVQGAIQGQIDAFNQDDFQTAFDFAAPSIQQIFGNSKRFEQMVRNGFPMVVRQNNFEFKEQQQIDDMAVQDVLIEDDSGDLHLLRYRLILLKGHWKIRSVEIVPSSITAV